MVVLTPPPDGRSGRRDPLGGPLTTLLVVASLWLAALCGAIAARVFAMLYGPLGTALPAPTRAVLDAVDWQAPWLAAGLATLVVVTLRWRRSPRFAATTATLAAAAMLALTATLLTLALPFAPCGELGRLLLNDAGTGCPALNDG